VNPTSGCSDDSSEALSGLDDGSALRATVYLAIGLPDGAGSGGAMRDDLAEIQLALVDATRRMSQSGHPVRYLNGMYMPAQTRLLCVFCGESEETVLATVGLLGLPYVQIRAITDQGSS
jgi:hypothetical protein